MRLYRMIVPVRDINLAAQFYGALLGQSGERVSSGRHYFDCGGTLLACWDPIADGDPEWTGPNTGHIYLSTTEPLEDVQLRAAAASATPDPLDGEIRVQPWGERSFYASDPWGNPFCVVQAGTEYRGGAFTPGAPGSAGE
ncbi:VOC family protein [Rugosimonospora africana]|uniref:VOC domain-containing protein n=1 Tax=Rugosimonospora africana TaxID=556532 RepID=A0A8J3QVI3_9ACTN|nr:VOC family protein [Rugosimonospora africana]GIH18270.1 hypothetical protein Raf01_64420 [Rugosimonospora africana]